jgi:hypothetical protein
MNDCSRCGEPLIIGHICKGSIGRKKIDSFAEAPQIQDFKPDFCSWTIRNGESDWTTGCKSHWPPLDRQHPRPAAFLTHLESKLKYCPMCGKEIFKKHEVDATWITEQLGEIQARKNQDESIYDAGLYICQFLRYLNFPTMADKFQEILDSRELAP